MNLTLPSEELQDPIWYNTFVTFIIFLVGALGITWNALAIIVVHRNPVLRNSFGLLCVSHSIANLGVLIVFFVYCGPTTAMREYGLSETLLGKRLGQINIFFWDCCVYSHLAISVNRLISISFPQSAQRILSIRNTCIILCIVWLLGAAHATPYWWYKDCFIAYSASTWTWDFAQTICGQIISIYFDYYTGIGVFTIILIMDMGTFIQLRKINIAASHGQTGAFRESRRRVEQRFFVQALIQESIFFYELLNFYYIYTLGSHPLFIYFTTTFAWEISHALDGLVVVIFHYRGAFFRSSTRSALISTASVTQL